MALSDGEGGMLYPQGARLLLGLGSNPHRGEEWFVLQRCPTWITLRSKTRKFLSIVYGKCWVQDSYGGRESWLLRREKCVGVQQRFLNLLIRKILGSQQDLLDHGAG